MIQRFHAYSGAFNWRCLFHHLWGEWSRPMVRTSVAGRFLGNDFVWTQRKCKRCGAGQGREIPSDE